MKRLLRAAAMTTFFLLVFPNVTYAGMTAAGAACSKAGATSNSGSKKFTCIKVGKKLVWDKGVALAKPVDSPTPSASPSPTKSSASAAFKNPVPITLPVPQTGAITFANVVSNVDQIPSVAWQQVQDAISSNPDVIIPTTIHIGPNTAASNSAINTGLSRINKLFAGFSHVSSYSGIVYNAKDTDWAEADADALFKKNGIASAFTRAENIHQLVTAGCEMRNNKPFDCGGGMSWDFRDGKSDAGGAYYGVQSNNGNSSTDFWTDENKNVGPMTQVNHEATHNYQAAQFMHTPLGSGQNTNSDLSHAFTPWWFSEGQANGIGVSSFIDNLQSYTNIRNDLVTRPGGSNTALPAFTADGLKGFLTKYQETGPQNPNWQLAYSIGYATVEALIAIGGPQSTLALYALGGNGEDWATAFQHVYGISWDQGSTILGQVLAAEYAAKPMQKR